LAHKFAIENPQITVEAISAVAMPELARAYNVLGTPHTILNNQIQLIGQIEETELLAALESLGDSRKQ
jgi:protein-disulfide isomerase